MTEEHIGCLFEEYKNSIYRLCVQLTNNQADADDLFQDTFMRVLQKYERIDINQNPKSYLCTMCLNLWKTGNRKRTAIHIPNESDYLTSLETPESILLLKEDKQIIAQAIKTLKDKYRIPVYLYYMEDMSVLEIAHTLRVPEGTVKSRLHKARSILRERLGWNYDDK